MIKGLCSGCFTHLEKYTIDWSEQKSRLLAILENARKKSKSSYDCIVPICGDAEDYHVVNLILEHGINPLLVGVNDYFMNDIGWSNLHNLITHFDLDSVVYSPEIGRYKELVSTSLRKYNHGMWPSLALRSAFPVHVAKQRKIPLIVYGQNQAIEQVGKFSHLDEVQATHWSRVQHDLIEVDVQELLGSGGHMDPKDIPFYSYPNLLKLGAGSVIGIYLSNYFCWDPLAQNSAVIDHGFKPQSQRSTFDPFERAGSSMYYEFHDLSKYLRCGYRKISDHVAREIRHNRLDTDIGSKIVGEYTQRPIYVRGFFDWLGVTKSGYQWFLNNKLATVSHMITEDSTLSTGLSESVPDNIRQMITSEVKPRLNFQRYLKGISL